MSYQTKVISFNSDADRTEQFDHFMQVEMKDKDVSLKDAVVGSSQAIIIYKDNTNEQSNS